MAVAARARPERVGAREKAIHLRSGMTRAQCGGGTLCNKEDGGEGEKGKGGGGCLAPEGEAKGRQIRVDTRAFRLVVW